MFLLDTNVLSALRRPSRHPELARWASGQAPDGLYVSVLTLGEVEAGVARARRDDPPFAQALEAWLSATRTGFEGRVLPFTRAAALIWGRLSVLVGNSGIDVQIAATALEHDLTVVTRNVRHFAGTGVRLLDPFDAA